MRAAALIVCILGLLAIAASARGDSGSYKGKSALYWAHATRGQVHARRQRERTIVRLRAENSRLRRQLAQTRTPVRRDVTYALSLAADTFGVPESQLWAVARCESQLWPYAEHPSSHASGLLQFLPSTWREQGLPRFSVFDPVPNALAAARIVAREGWGQWVCKP